MTCDSLVNELRKQFPIFAYQRSLHMPFVYFDHAATALKPRMMLDAMEDYYTKYTGNIHRGVHRTGYQASEEYEAARKRISQFIHAKSEKEIIFTSGTTASINHFARSFSRTFLKPGDRVILSAMEHHANLVCWQEMAKEFQLTLDFLPFNSEGDLDLKRLDNLLKPPTRLLSVLAVSNTLGTINPIPVLAQKCRARGVYTFVDAAQSIGHMPTNVQADNIDFLAFSGHKVFGPTGIGVLWGRQELLHLMPPFFYGGGIVREVDLQSCEYLGVPQRFEAGTPPIAEAIGLGKAIEFVQQVGWENIQKIEAQNKACAEDIFSKQREFVQVYGNSKNKIDIFSFHLPQIHAHDIGSYMAEMGIAMRSGHQCTQPITKHFSLTSLSRISSSLYNDCADWAYFEKSLKEMLRFFRVT